MDRFYGRTRWYKAPWSKYPFEEILTKTKINQGTG